MSDMCRQDGGYVWSGRKGMGEEEEEEEEQAERIADEKKVLLEKQPVDLKGMPHRESLVWKKKPLLP